MPDYLRVPMGLRLAVTVVVLFTTSCGLQETVGFQAIPTGQVSPSPAPTLSGRGVNGEQIDLAKLRGHVVLIDFWGSWCGPCRAEQPGLTAMANKYSKVGVDFLGDDMRDDDTAARGYMATYKVPYPSVSDASGEHAALFNVVAPPTIFVIDQRGQIRGQYLGTLAGVSDLLDQLLRSR